MPLIDKLGGKVTGNGEEKERRQVILTALLEAFERGGGDAVSELLEEKLKRLEVRFDAKLAALEQKL
jgi:hypothetical protein